jgi:hypothetical protein
MFVEEEDDSALFLDLSVNTSNSGFCDLLPNMHYRRKNWGDEKGTGMREMTPQRYT